MSTMKVSRPESLEDFVDEQAARGGYGTLVFYIERDDHVDVWRVWHGQRDIPAWMHDT